VAEVARPVASDGGSKQVVRATLRWLVGNSLLMVLALILAALAWVAAVEEEDPTIEERYPQPLPIAPSELAEGMLIVGDSDGSMVGRAQVVVRAPRSVWNSLEVDDFTVRVDLTGLSAGTHKVPVQVTLDRSPSRVVSVEPDYVTLELELETEQVVPVHVQVKGEPALGYLMQPPIVIPRQVTVKGPSSYVSQVVEAVTQVSVQDASEPVEGEFRVRHQGSEGQTVPYVTLTPEVVEVRVPIELSVYYRPLVVKVALEGQVAPGYRIADISFEPSTVTVFGAPQVIAVLPGYIETKPVNVESAQADVVERPALNVPPDIAVVPGQPPVEVRVSVEAIQSSVTKVITPEIQGLEPGFTATVSPETVEEILSGPLPLLDALEEDDVRVVLDLFRLAPGIHQIEPQVVVPEGLVVQSILPATLQVEISRASTPTPTEE